MPEILRNLTRNFVLWSSLLTSSLLLALFMNFLIYDTKVLQFTHIAFFILMLTYIGYFIERIDNHLIMKDSVEQAYRVTIIPFFIMFTFMGVSNASLGIKMSFFGFDDKSHAVLFMTFYAFFALRLLNGEYKYIISIIFMFLALLTISRLVIFFLPFYLYVFGRHVFRTKKLSYRVVAVIWLIAAIIFVIYNWQNYFLVFQRVSGNDKAASTSTSHHLEMIKVALLYKIENVFNFIIGTGPGNFGTLLASSRVPTFLTRAYAFHAHRGLIPIHSSHVQIFLEFSLVVFVVYMWFLYKIWKGCRRNNDIDALCFYIPLLIATVFYSTHNEVLYWMILLFLFTESRPI